MFDFNGPNLANRDVPLFSLDDADRKIIKKMKAWAGWSLFTRFFFIAAYIIGIILTVAGAVQLSVANLPPLPTQAQLVSFKCQLAFGIIFLILALLSIIVLLLFDYKVAKYTKILQKYDDNTHNSWITRYYWAVAQHKWLFFFFMMRFGFILDIMIISRCRKTLKLTKLTPQEEQAKEEAWLNNFTANQNNSRSVAYRLSLRRKKDEENNLPGSDPTKN